MDLHRFAAGVVLVHTLALVIGFLNEALVFVALEIATQLVLGIGEALLDLVLGRLGGVRGQLVSDLC